MTWSYIPNIDGGPYSNDVSIHDVWISMASKMDVNEPFLSYNGGLSHGIYPITCRHPWDMESTMESIHGI